MTTITEYLAEQKRWLALHEKNEYQREAATRLSRLVAALEAAVALHTKRDADAVTGACAVEECGHEEECPTETFETCAACWDLCEESDPYFGERGIAPVLWPCPTVRAIEAALGGEGDA